MTGGYSVYFLLLSVRYMLINPPLEDQNMISHTVTIDGYEPFACRADTTVMRTMCDTLHGPVTHGCCGGGCGVCKMRIVSGFYEIVSRMSRAQITELEEHRGIVLLCCIVPRSDLVIEQV